MKKTKTGVLVLLLVLLAILLLKLFILERNREGERCWAAPGPGDEANACPGCRPLFAAHPGWPEHGQDPNKWYITCWFCRPGDEGDPTGVVSYGVFDSKLEVWIKFGGDVDFHN